MTKTFTPKAGDIEKKWVVVDADGQVLGRLASKVAQILRGKNKPIFTPHLDTGDNVIIVNAEKIRITGKKADTKKYYRYSGYPGGLHAWEYRKLLKDRPERILRHAIWGMLPHNRLGRKLLTNVRIYAGPEHKQNAQMPEKIEI